MRRALVVLALALAAAAPAAAVNPGQAPTPGGGGLPIEKSGSSIGEGLPLKAYASITPTVHLFGDMLTAKLAVIADTKWVDPVKLHVTTSFAPYAPIKEPQRLQLRYGRFEQITWTWKLRCLDSLCVPRTPPNDKFHVFHFAPAHVQYGKPGYAINAYWPPVEVLSQISPGVARFLVVTKRIHWRTGMTPVATPTYRFSPTTVYWVALVLAILAAAAALLLGTRWYLRINPRRAVATGPPGTPLERALAVLRYAHETGDETLQRKAFERVAGELGVERADELSVQAKELAWSPRTPQDEEVEQFAVQALHVGEEDE